MAASYKSDVPHKETPSDVKSPEYGHDEDMEEDDGAGQAEGWVLKA